MKDSWFDVLTAHWKENQVKTVRRNMEPIGTWKATKKWINFISQLLNTIVQWLIDWARPFIWVMFIRRNALHSEFYWIDQQPRTNELKSGSKKMAISLNSKLSKQKHNIMIQWIIMAYNALQKSLAVICVDSARTIKQSSYPYSCDLSSNSVHLFCWFSC